MKTRVMHDFSRIKGTIKATVKGNHRYRYFVLWDTGESDWYEKKVLVFLDE